MPSEDDPEQLAQMEKAAKAMGMSLEEYRLGMTARVRLAKKLDESKVAAGDAGTVSIERDANNPPKMLEIKITDAGKELGASKVGAALVAALKTCSDEARKKRAEAQKDMMTYISDEMKALGKA